MAKKATSADFKEGQKYATALLLNGIRAAYPSMSNNEIAKLFGPKKTQASISQWETGIAAPNKSAMVYLVEHLLSRPPRAILEFEPIVPFRAPGRTRWRLAEHDTERNRLKNLLAGKRGVYIFFDSAAQSTYVGQAKKATTHDMFGEIEQQLKQVYSGKTLFRTAAGSLRATAVAQAQIVRFLSVYETVSPLQAHNVEALLLRTSMNHTGNARSGDFKFHL